MFINQPKPYVYAPLDKDSKPSICGGLFFNKSDRNPIVALDSLSNVFKELSDSFVQVYNNYYRINSANDLVGVIVKPIDSCLDRADDFAVNARVNDRTIRENMLSFLKDNNSSFYINRLVDDHLHYAFLLDNIFNERLVSNFFINLGGLAIRFSGLEPAVDLMIEKDYASFCAGIRRSSFDFEFL